MLDEWAAINNYPHEGNETFETTGGTLPRNVENPIFSIDILERHATKGHGLVTSMSAGNNVILVGSNRGWLVRHDFGGGDSLELDLNASRGVEHTIHRVVIDPGGRHSFASVCSTAGAENYYIHAKWKSARLLSKLKGLVINTVAWNRQLISDATTAPVIVGTTTGQLFELLVEEKDKREKYLNKLFELTERLEPFVGVQMETVGSGASVRYLVMAATPSRLYVFVGNGSLELVFQEYSDQVTHFTELPGDMPNSQLHFFGKQRRMERFAWLSGPGIYHGRVNMGTSQSEDNHLDQKSLLKYSNISRGNSTVKPSSLALTEFHFLVLYGHSLKVVNIASQEVVEDKRFDANLTTTPMIGLCSDVAAGVYYAYSENSIFEISANDESRDMWLVYLNMKEYAAALEHCRDTFQRDHVYATQAEAAFKAGEYLIAASFFAKANSVATFEEVALKFVSVGEQDALRAYLLRKLDYFGQEDRAQVTMIATWATELYLDKLNRLLMSESKQMPGGADSEESQSAEYRATLKEFLAFLSDCKNVLDEATTMKLLGSYGRVDELIYFAGLKEQYEILVHHFIQQGDAKRALAVLRKPTISPELQYKHAPALIMVDPHATVESWIAANLKPRRLIPALMRYANGYPPKDEANAAIRYLEFCVQRQQNEDSAIHNLLLSLYAKQEDESALLLFLDSKFGKGRPGMPDIFYDPKYALRLCLEEKRMRACVFIYGLMGMHEEAVSLALQIDPELAKREAMKVDDDEGLRKKLWLMVAKHVIQQDKGVQAENIRMAVALLKETNGLLKIEDILPFFPDFSLIDDFKEAICTSLEDYTKEIEELKREMNGATHGADNIRRDINSLTERYAIVNQNEDCGICGKRILMTAGTWSSRPVTQSYSTSVMAPFYVFPCEHSFHAQCLTDYVVKHTDKFERERIGELYSRLATMTTQGSSQTSRKTMNGRYEDETSAQRQIEPVDQVRAQLDDAVGGECPFCGELMLREITQPFISPEQTDLIASWAIHSGTVAKESGFS